jgi:hypothetical protein
MMDKIVSRTCGQEVNPPLLDDTNVADVSGYQQLMRVYER